MGDLSAHFSRREFLCKHCSTGCASPQLLAILEDVRTRIGNKPIRVVSGFRCRPYNESLPVSGALSSRHLHCDAVDVPAGLVPIAVARASSAVGIGRSGAWAIHLDWRPGGRAEWSY